MDLITFASECSTYMHTSHAKEELARFMPASSTGLERGGEATMTEGVRDIVTSYLCEQNSDSLSTLEPSISSEVGFA